MHFLQRTSPHNNYGVRKGGGAAVIITQDIIRRITLIFIMTSGLSFGQKLMLRKLPEKSGFCWTDYEGYLSRVTITQSVLRRATSSMAGVRFLAGARDISVIHSVQIGSGAHTTSYKITIENYFREGKRAGTWSWPASSAEVRNDGNIPPLVHMSPWHCA
jgi:hypothetical protein